MGELDSWDWNTRAKIVADINEWKEKFHVIRGLVVSDDGEKIASVVQTEDKHFTTYVNGEVWEEAFDRVYSLKFNPDNQLLCFVYRNFEWNFAVDHELREETFEFIWNLTLTPDGKGVAFNIKREEGKLGVCLNGQAWENMFTDARDLAVSPDGKRTASRVQIKPIPSLDIFTYQQGVWTVAVDGTPWDNKYWSVWGVVFSPDSNHVAACVRTGFAQYNIAVDGKTWEGAFGSGTY